ncbi:ABC transporter ATP-binding protein [Oscillatoria laete-virens NRMC-F 0139]|nr:ABC transporter ATP-binding protein [Oscillatoria laete-virens]MDL5054422.1 ABC transporter ATP-binding protein [Oscillatoria laete-virens NRMC-F 0139]
MNWYFRLLKYLAPYKGRFIAGIVCGVIYAAANAGLISVTKIVTEYVFPPTAPGLAGSTDGTGDKKPFSVFPQFEKRLGEMKESIRVRFMGWLPSPQEKLTLGATLLLAFMIPAIIAVRGLFNYLNGYLLSWVGIRVVMDIRTALYEHILKLSMAFYTKSSTGDLMSRINNDTGQIQRAVVNLVADLVKQPLTLIGALAALIILNPTLSLLAFVFFPLCLLPIIIYGRKVRVDSRASQKNLGELHTLVHESFTGARVVKAFCREDAEIKKFRDNSNRLIYHTMRIVRSNTILSPIIETLGAAGVSLLFIYIFVSGMNPSDLFAFMAGMFVLYQPTKALSKIHLALQNAAASAERVFEILDHQQTVGDKPGAGALPAFSREVRFEHVTFKYADEKVLKSVDLVIPKGSYVALVGRSGSGKTTMGNLLCRFYDPVEGRVLIDGIDLREVTQESLRKQIGIVSQETILFNDTMPRISPTENPTRPARRSPVPRKLRTRMDSSRRCPTDMTRKWGKKACKCPEVSVSASPSRARSSPTRAFSFSMRRLPRWTPRVNAPCRAPSTRPAWDAPLSPLRTV